MAGYAHVFKYNPNHDKNGRFAASSSGGGVASANGAKPSKPRKTSPHKHGLLSALAHIFRDAPY